MKSNQKGESSEEIKQRVIKSRAIQSKRFDSISGVYCNSLMSSGLVDIFCSLDQKSTQLLARSVTKLGLSTRAYHRILKVGRTIADLAEADTIQPQHIAEATQYCRGARALSF